MSWLSDWTDYFRAPWARYSDIDARLIRISGGVEQMNTKITTLGVTMAADREMLATIAEGLTALSAPVSDLIASEAALRARVVELEGEAAADEAGDLAAAGAVKSAFDDLAGKFAAEPEVPDVAPLPEAPVAEPVDESGEGEPTPAA
jgi:hypothetical protein